MQKTPDFEAGNKRDPRNPPLKEERKAEADERRLAEGAERT